MGKDNKKKTAERKRIAGKDTGESGAAKPPAAATGNVFLAFIVKIFCVAICVLVFSNLSYLFNEMYVKESHLMKYMMNSLGFLVAGALMGVLIAPHVQAGIEQSHMYFVSMLKKYPAQSLASGSVGVVVGMVFSVFAVMPLFIFFPEYKMPGFIAAVTFSIIFGYLGSLVFSRVSFLGDKRAAAARAGQPLVPDSARPKVLDSSALIDGRIYILVKAGFIEGRFLVPSFVLNEIQKIADDTDPVRRQRGRAGLDIIDKMRDELGADVSVVPAPRVDLKDPENAVDSRLVLFTKEAGGALVTNDYNLSRVAELQNVAVYNLNILANTLRKNLLPGETVDVSVVKYGKEQGQGIAYLDDGTMVVIESGDKFVGDDVTVEISSIMQTVAGRLIFARIPRQGQRSNGRGEKH